jgi:hypothetical protein
MFFFEKKNQKTFPGAARRLLRAASQVRGGYKTDFIRPTQVKRAKHPGNVFWFFFVVPKARV